MIDKLVFWLPDVNQVNEVIEACTLVDTDNISKYCYALDLDRGHYNYFYQSQSKIFRSITNVKYNGYKFQVLQRSLKSAFLQINPNDFPDYTEFSNYICKLGLLQFDIIVRADYQVDLFGSVSQFFNMVYKNKARSLRCFYGSDGQLETVYIGKNPLIRIYQKDRELRKVYYTKCNKEFVRVEIQKRYDKQQKFRMHQAFNATPFSDNKIQCDDNTFDLFKKSYISLNGIHNLRAMYAKQKHLSRFEKYCHKGIDLDTEFQHTVELYRNSQPFKINVETELLKNKLPLSRSDYQSLYEVNKSGCLPVRFASVKVFQKLYSFELIQIHDDKIGLTELGLLRLNTYIESKRKNHLNYKEEP